MSGERASDPVRFGGVGVEEAVAVGSATREEAVAIGELGSSWPPWKGSPQRYKLIGATSLAFVICNMDKVNLSVAIIPMSRQFGWNASMAGLVQSSFFWGYALSQLPSGWLAKIFGGRVYVIANDIVLMADALPDDSPPPLSSVGSENLPDNWIFISGLEHGNIFFGFWIATLGKIVIILTCGLGLSSFALSGRNFDYSWNDARTILYASGYFTRICNYTFGHYKHRRSVAGIIGVALTGYLFDSTYSWSVFLFAPSIFFYLTGTVVWLTFASRRPQKFSKTE